MDWSILVVILQLIFLEGILSIDNAAVLGALVAPLPSDQNIPWPRSLARLGRALDPLLGKQRLAALRVGLLGAYAGRSLMLAVASLIVQTPWLKMVGAAYLIRLAIDDLGSSSDGANIDEEGQRQLKRRTFWSTVLTVELMDLAFSLDNVVAAVSLSDKLWVVIVGVAIGILTMRFAAGIFSYLVEKEPVLQRAAYILILNIGVELLLEDLAHIEISDWLKFAISISTLLLAVVYERLAFLRVFRPVLIWVSQGLAILNNLVSWLLVPPFAIFHVAWRAVRPLLSRPAQAGS
jgi:tellurite resistance protein TerC